jgi:hypothetical protein
VGGRGTHLGGGEADGGPPLHGSPARRGGRGRGRREARNRGLGEVGESRQRIDREGTGTGAAPKFSHNQPKRDAAQLI